MIPAADARLLQQTGVPQSEYYTNAYNRCNDAIVDQSRKGKGNVTVAVYFLTDESVSKLQEEIEKHGYSVSEVQRVNGQCHSFNVKWSYLEDISKQTT